MTTPPLETVSVGTKAPLGRSETKADQIILSALLEAAWAIDWCINEHYAPNASREKRALAGVKRALKTPAMKRAAQALAVMSPRIGEDPAP